MDIQTFSIIAGSEACNAKCPYCISKMTPIGGLLEKVPEVNWRNFRKAARLARDGGASTAMITGKGEPTLFPEQISRYLEELVPYDFPIVELQTNGILLEDQPEKYAPFLREWYMRGLTVIAVSIVHYLPEENRTVFTPYRENYMVLDHLIGNLHDVGYTVRLACILADGYVDSGNELEKLVDYARENKVEQLTVRPVNHPLESRSESIMAWNVDHHLKEDQWASIENFVAQEGKRIMSTPYGATVYDVHGQNLCVTNSLTIDDRGDDVRQVIFFPDGRVRYDWQYAGAVLI